MFPLEYVSTGEDFFVLSCFLSSSCRAAGQGRLSLSCPASSLRLAGRQDRTGCLCPVLLPLFVLPGGRTGPAVLCSAFFVLSCFLSSSCRAAGQDRLSCAQHFLSCPASSLRPVGQQDRTACPALSIFCPVLLPLFVLSGSRTGPAVLCSAFFVLSCFLSSSSRAAEQDRLSCAQHFLSCPASSLRPAGRQDKTKIKNASCPTGHQDRLSCAQL